ncbi:MAG: sterol desaturase family protein, partial [Chitinophagales bacterium]
MDFSNIMHDRNLRVTGIVIVSLFVLGNLAECIYSYYRQKHYYTYHSFLINISIALLQQLTDVFNKIIFFMGFVFVQEHYSIQRLFHWREIQIDFPFTLTAHFPFLQINGYMLFVWIFILVLADFCQYWLHRLSHEVNIMWAGHIVHHSMEEYNYTVALRQSFIESVYTWIFYLPLAFFGIPWQLFIMAYAVSLIWQFFVHTRLVGKLGLLEKIMATPSHHRVHHGKNPQYIDKNYGAFFIIWDKIFGTFEPEVEAVDYGVTVPLQTQNPIWVNVHHHLHIFKMVSKTKGLKNKWMVFWGKPAFIPSDIESEYQKLKLLSTPEKNHLPTEKSIYLFL